MILSKNNLKLHCLEQAFFQRKGKNIKIEGICLHKLFFWQNLEPTEAKLDRKIFFYVFLKFRVGHLILR
jgi:hypothetical protein